MREYFQVCDEWFERNENIFFLLFNFIIFIIHFFFFISELIKVFHVIFYKLQFMMQWHFYLWKKILHLFNRSLLLILRFIWYGTELKKICE